MTKLIPVGKHAHAIVDDEDYETLSKWKWSPYGRRYAATGKLKVKMEWMILKPPEGKQIDHKNGNGLDNRRENLRTCTQKQNARNRRAPQIPGKSSRFKGVRFRPERGKWSAYVGTREWLGIYGSEEEAALAYNLAAMRHFGEFAQLNDISATVEQLAEAARKLQRNRRSRLYRERKKQEEGRK